MTLALLVGPQLAPPTLQCIRTLMPELQVVTELQGADLAAIRILCAFAVPPGTFGRLPGLELVCCSGAGADALVGAVDLPDNVPVTRTLDPLVTAGLCEYALYVVLREHRAFPAYEQQQRQRVWQRIAVPAAAETGVAVLGLGNIGSAVAQRLAAMDYRVTGWSRTPRSVPGVQCLHGDDGLQQCLSANRFVICLLPLTPQTTGLFDARTLARMLPGSTLINLGRGGHVVAGDLLAALDSGHLASAVLDVHEVEPLPPEHPLWAHPRVTVTPHIAARTAPAVLAEQLCANIRRLQAGEPLLNLVDRQRGY